MATLIPNAGEVLIAAVVALFGLVATATLAAWWLRRHWDRLGHRVMRRVRRVAADHSGSALRWVLSRPLPDRRWRMLWRTRRELAASAAGAKKAVELACRSGAPMGDLDSMCRRLGPAALELDRVLAVAQCGRDQGVRSDDLVGQAHQLSAAASTLRHAALVSVAHVPGTRWAELAGEIELEAHAIHAGLASLNSAATPPGPAWPGSFRRLPVAHR